MAQRPPSNRAVFEDPSVMAVRESAAPRGIIDELADEGLTPDVAMPKPMKSAPGPKHEPVPAPAQAQQAEPAPQPAKASMAEGQKPELPGGKATVDQCRSLAQSVVSSLMSRLKAEAQRRGGHLSLKDLTALSGEFEKRSEALETAVKKSFEGYVRDRARAMQNDSRQYPFDRIIVHQFSHLFVKRERADLAQGALSRRVLPGFFVAIEKMLGEEVMEELQNRARRIIARFEEHLDSDSGWEEIYADGFTQALVLDSLVTMSGYFQDFAKRADWFMNMINGHLPPGDAVHGEGAAAAVWELEPQPCADMLVALFAPLVYKLSTEKGRTAIADRYGPEIFNQTMTVASQVQAIEDARG